VWFLHVALTRVFKKFSKAQDDRSSQHHQTCFPISSFSQHSPCPPLSVLSLSSLGSDSADQSCDSSIGALASSVVAPLALSLSPAVSPEEFERLWLQRHTLHSEQGNDLGGCW